jgi:hypothetical protein
MYETLPFLWILNELQFGGKYEFTFFMQVCDQFFSVIIFNMFTGLKILKMTFCHVELYILITNSAWIYFA